MRGSLDRKRAKDGYLLILPWLVGFVVFTAGPIIVGLSLAFTKYDILSPPRWAGLANFRRLVGDALVVETIFNSFVITVFSVVPRLLIALGLAILVNQKLRFVGVFRTIFYTPTIVPAFASAILWMLLMQKDAGVINYYFGIVGLSKPGWLTDPGVSKVSMAIMTLFYFGPQMLIFLGCFTSSPPRTVRGGDGGWCRPNSLFLERHNTVDLARHFFQYGGSDRGDAPDFHSPFYYNPRFAHE